LESENAARLPRAGGYGDATVALQRTTIEGLRFSFVATFTSFDLACACFASYARSVLAST
jgi:hypothetical protein